MEYIYLKEKDENYNILKGFFVPVKETEMNGIKILEVPQVKKRREYIRLVKKIRKKRVKGICYGKIKNEALLYTIKQEFYTFDGEKIFYKNFLSIISFFASLKNISLQECTLIFISDNPFTIEKYISSVYKKVKRISVITNKKTFFTYLSEKCRQEYGIYMEIKSKEDKCKKYNHIYINMEKHKIISDDKLKGCHLLDIYRKYKKGFSEIIVENNMQEDEYMKKYEIEKNIRFIEFIEKIKGNNEGKDDKIVNIKKYD